MRRDLVSSLIIIGGLSLSLACQQRSGVARSPSATTPTPATAVSGATTSLASLVRDERARAQAYLQAGAAGGGLLSQLHRLELGHASIDRSPIDASLDVMDRRPDTADFHASKILRLAWLHGSNPALPVDVRDHMRRAIKGFRYSLEDPGRDGMCFWSENHQIIFASTGYLAGHLFPQDTFANSGLTGAQLAARERVRVIRWLQDRWTMGFSEWFSPVYYSHDLAPLFNLVDFAPDPDVQALATMVVDLMIFDLARLTQRGSFGVTAGRCYVEHKQSGRRQSVGDLIEVLFGTRGEHSRGGSTAATPYVTSRRYRVPPVLLAIGRHQPVRSVDRARNGIGFGEAAQFGKTFTSFEDGIFWWGMGAYVAPETVQLSRRMLDAWDLWHSGFFAPLAALRGVPDGLLPAISGALSPVTRGSVLSRADSYTFRTPDSMLSSVQDYRPGQVGYQQHAWQATFDLDTAVFTTAPATLGRYGPGHWTGSASLPRVIQVEDTAVILYDPSLPQRLLFPAMTHAFFPQASFDEVVQAGSWTFGRKGDGYVGLLSAQPTAWVTTGQDANRELIASGHRNAWICVVGRRAEDGGFADFRSRLLAAALHTEGVSDVTRPLAVRFEAPGIGTLEIPFHGAATRNGAPLAVSGFPRYDNPYSFTPFAARNLTIHHAGAVLEHGLDARTRVATGF